MSRLEGFSNYIQDAMASWHCPGVAIAIVKEDDVLFQGAFGLGDVEEQRSMAPETRFAMASVTKSFTAMSVALLVDEGKLAWDKPVRDHLPEFILDDPYVTQHVTVRDMLSHRTGLPRHDLAAWRLDVSRADFVKRMRHLKFSASFRERFQYNNLMYYASAYLVERLAGKRWEEFVQERIFSPLGMNASNLLPEPPREGQVNAKGYRVDRDEEGGAKGLIPTSFGHHTELSPGAAGALFSTLADLIQWLKVHLNGGRIGGTQFVTPENLQQMHLPQTIVPGGGFKEALFGNTIFTYGLGWGVEPYRGYTLVQHGGNVEGHSLMIGFVPQEKLGVVALTNIAMLPLRDVLLYEAIDRALALPDRDWNSRFHELFDPLIKGEAKGKQTAAEEQLDDAPPTHPIETYTGVYEADGYPDFAVKLEGESWQARTVGSLDWSELRHYHYNVFEWHLRDFDLWIKVRFLINDSGEITEVSIPLEPEVDDIVFRRKQPELSEALVAALVGEYDTPVKGVSFSITAHAGKVYAAQSGSPPEEIKPYTLNPKLVGFRMKRSRLDFVRQDDLITQLVLKTPFMTLEAPRRQ
jgi:CubicO group peptidase (beta-lactamase class C family)